MTQKGIESVLFPAFDYKAIKQSVYTDCERVQYKLNPDKQQSTYTPRSIIRFDLPAHDFLDLSNTTFNFNAKATGTSEQTCFNPFIECIIYKLSIWLGNGSDIVEQILNYNLDASSTFKHKTSLNYGLTLGGELQGYQESQDRIFLARNPDQNGNDQGARYVVNLLGSGLFNGSNLRYLPMGPMAQINGFNRSLHIQIELESPDYCMQDFAENPVAGGKNYEISEVYMNLEIIKSPSYESKLIQEIQNGRTIAIPLISTDLEPNQITQGRSGNINFPIMKQRQWVTGCKALFISPYTDPKKAYTWQYGRPSDLRNYQYQILNRYFPPEPVKLNGEDNNANQIGELMKYFNKLKNYKDGTLIGDQLDFASPPNARELEVDDIDAVININANTLVFLKYNDRDVDTDTYNVLQTTPAFSFNVKKTGLYDVNLQFQCVFGVPTNNSVFRVGLYDNSTLSWVDECFTNTTVNNTGQPDDEKQIFINKKNVELSEDGEYFFAVQWQGAAGTFSANVNTSFCQIEWSDGQFSYDKTDFVIGQTFKVFYDQDEHILGDYIMDGVSTMQSSSIMLNMDLGQPPNEQFSVFNFVNYMKMIIIDNTGVKVYQ